MTSATEGSAAVEAARRKVLNDAQNYPGFRELVAAFEAAIRADERAKDKCATEGHDWRQFFEQTGWNDDTTPRIQPMGFYCTGDWRHRDA